MSSINAHRSTITGGSDEADDFDTTSGWDDEEEAAERVDTEQHSMSPQDRETMEGIRAFGVSMCNLVIRTLPQMPEEVVHRCLRCLTTPLESIDPNVFCDVEEEVGAMLLTNVPITYYYCLLIVNTPSFLGTMLRRFQTESILRSCCGGFRGI